MRLYRGDCYVDPDYEDLPPRRLRRYNATPLPIVKETHYWTGEPLEARLPKAPGYILYEGPSLYDEKPIVVIATGFIRPSVNIKTGKMIQTYILRSDIHPVEASRAAEDKSICGRCKHLGVIIPGMGKIPPSKRSRKIPSRTKRSCYVRLDHVGNIYAKYKSNGYVKLNTPKEIENVFKRAPYPPRLGSYGDPVMVPLNIWEAVVRFKTKWTGYTSQWRLKRAQEYKPYLQASVNSYAEYYEAKELGWSTYRVGRKSEPILPTETYCPYTPEGGGRLLCCDCNLCMGTTVMRHDKKSKDILTRPHGTGTRFHEERESRKRFFRRRRNVDLPDTPSYRPLPDPSEKPREFWLDLLANLTQAMDTDSDESGEGEKRAVAAGTRSLELLSKITDDELDPLVAMLLEIEEAIVHNETAQQNFKTILLEADSPYTPAHEVFTVFLEEPEEEEECDARKCLKLLKAFVEELSEARQKYQVRQDPALLDELVAATSYDREQVIRLLSAENDEEILQDTADELDVDLPVIISWLHQDLDQPDIVIPPQIECAMILDLLGLPY